MLKSMGQGFFFLLEYAVMDDITGAGVYLIHSVL